MKVLHVNEQNLDELKKSARPCVMALGFFDGVHKGHQAVIEQARLLAEEGDHPLVVMTFFPHPKTVLHGEAASFPYIMPLSEKIEQLHPLGVDLVYVVEFSRKFLTLSPTAFVMNYLLGLEARHVVAGYDFTYGHKGEGKVERLESDARGLLKATKVEKVSYQGKKISSTWIRQLLQEGEVGLLRELLGRNYVTAASRYADQWRIEAAYRPLAAGSYRVLIHDGKDQLARILRLNGDGRSLDLSSVTGVDPLADRFFIEWQEKLDS